MAPYVNQATGDAARRLRNPSLMATVKLIGKKVQLYNNSKLASIKNPCREGKKKHTKIQVHMHTCVKMTWTHWDDVINVLSF